MGLERLICPKYYIVLKWESRLLVYSIKQQLMQLTRRFTHSHQFEFPHFY